MYFNISLMPNKTPISTRALYFPLSGSENACDFGLEFKIDMDTRLGRPRPVYEKSLIGSFNKVLKIYNYIFFIKALIMLFSYFTKLSSFCFNFISSLG